VELTTGVVGPLATNVYLLADPATSEALAIDTATPSVDWLVANLERRGWTLKLVVSTHGHWDHIGDNAAVQEHTGAPIAVHPLDRDRLEHPRTEFAPFPIPPSVPAIELAEGGRIDLGALRLEVLHTPGHTEGSCCLLERESHLLFTGDTLFQAGWGRTDLPGGSPEAMADSLARLARLGREAGESLRVLPGHGRPTTIGAELPWLDLVAREGRLIA
jgi:glyoxylase-like metal-dependent hydrolase (beta-lactamase superfamily II)